MDSIAVVEGALTLTNKAVACNSVEALGVGCDHLLVQPRHRAVWKRNKSAALKMRCRAAEGCSVVAPARLSPCLSPIAG